jgi:hypothetical protein
VLLQGPPHNIPSHFVIDPLQVNKTICKSFFCSLYLSISCLIKKIASIVDLLGIKPNWFSVTLVTLLKVTFFVGMSRRNVVCYITDIPTMFC